MELTGRGKIFSSVVRRVSRRKYHRVLRVAGEERSSCASAAVSVLEEGDKAGRGCQLEFPIIERVMGPDCKSSGWEGRSGKVFSSALHRAPGRRQRWARFVKGDPRVNGSGTEIPVLKGIVGGASISERGVENAWATGKALLVFVSLFFATERELGAGLEQTRGSAVSEATAIPELVSFRQVLAKTRVRAKN